MRPFKTIHEQKSALLTSAIVVLLILLFSIIGITYYDPPITYGMEIEFGNLYVNQESNKESDKSIENSEKLISEKSKKTSSNNGGQIKLNKTINQNNSSEIINQKNKLNSNVNLENEKKKDLINKNQISKTTEKVISSFVNNLLKKEELDKIKSDNKIDSEKSDKLGNPYSTTYYSEIDKSVKNRGFGLNGRNLKSSNSFIQKCNQEGIVVVRIKVNSSGEVISANAGVKGSTNIHPCLIEPAEKTAYSYKWFPDSKAPNEQIGFVVIHFKLSE